MSSPRIVWPKFRAVSVTACCLIPVACMPTAENMTFDSAEMAAIEMAPEMSLAQQAVAPGGPLLILSGTVRVEVDDLDATVTGVRSLADQTDGFVAGSDFREGAEGARTASLTLRVPSEAFQSLVQQVSEMGRLLSVSQEASDISREYFDLETRLTVQTATVERLQELITQSGDLEDLLAVERELSRATSELESMKGQVAFYDQRVALSTLEVSLFEPGATITSGAFRPVVVAFRNSLNVLAESVGMVVYFLVFLLPWAILMALCWPIIQRVRRRRGTSQEG